MDYLTQYYKNLSEQLQQELEQLKEARNIVPAGSIKRPGVRAPTMISKDTDGSRFRKPIVSPIPGTPPPKYPPGLDPGTNHPYYPGWDHHGWPHGPGLYPYYYDEEGNPTDEQITPQ